MEQNIVERAAEAEIDNKRRVKGVGKVSWSTSKDRNRNIPITRR